MEAVRGVGHINANRSTTVSMEAIAVTTLLMNWNECSTGLVCVCVCVCEADSELVHLTESFTLTQKSIWKVFLLKHIQCRFN